MNSPAYLTTNSNTLSGGVSLAATLFFVILCRVGASISDVPVDGESL